MDADFSNKSNACVCKLDDAVQFIRSHGSQFHSIPFFETHAIHVTPDPAFHIHFLFCKKKVNFNSEKNVLVYT